MTPAEAEGKGWRWSRTETSLWRFLKDKSRSLSSTMNRIGAICLAVSTPLFWFIVNFITQRQRKPTWNKVGYIHVGMRMTEYHRRIEWKCNARKSKPMKVSRKLSHIWRSPGRWLLLPFKWSNFKIASQQPYCMLNSTVVCWLYWHVWSSNHHHCRAQAAKRCEARFSPWSYLVLRNRCNTFRAAVHSSSQTVASQRHYRGW